jgi:hypothetical protein
MKPAIWIWHHLSFAARWYSVDQHDDCVGYIIGPYFHRYELPGRTELGLY